MARSYFIFLSFYSIFTANFFHFVFKYIFLVRNLELRSLLISYRHFPRCFRLFYRSYFCKIMMASLRHLAWIRKERVLSFWTILPEFLAKILFTSSRHLPITSSEFYFECFSNSFVSRTHLALTFKACVLSMRLVSRTHLAFTWRVCVFWSC